MEGIQTMALFNLLDHVIIVYTFITVNLIVFLSEFFDLRLFLVHLFSQACTCKTLQSHVFSLSSHLQWSSSVVRCLSVFTALVFTSLYMQGIFSVIKIYIFFVEPLYNDLHFLCIALVFLIVNYDVYTFCIQAFCIQTEF